MKHKIMLVDDNLDLPYIVKKGLEKMNDKYEVIGANGVYKGKYQNVY